MYVCADGVYFNIGADDAKQCIRVLVGVVEHGPELAASEGALGFRKALSKVYGETRQQRCCVHKRTKACLHEIWMAASQEHAQLAFEAFLAAYEDKRPKIAEYLKKNRDTLLAFYDFPTPHWQHIQTTNPIDSTFATVRLRTAKTRGCVSRQSILALVYLVGLSAEKRWRRLRGFKNLADIRPNSSASPAGSRNTPTSTRREKV